jgi:plasmid maintenance system antidote protein VapI
LKSLLIAYPKTWAYQTRVSQIIKGKHRVTADRSLRLSKYFGTSPKFWLGLQDDFNIEEEQNLIIEDLKKIKRVVME